MGIDQPNAAPEMHRQGLITIIDDELHINPSRSRTLQLLASGARETLQRYAITFWLPVSYTHLTLPTNREV